MALTHFQVTMNDGTEHVVTPNLADTLAFETYLRNNRRLGKLADNTMRALAYRIWSAGRRSGVLTHETFDAFVAEAADFAQVELETEDVDEDDELEAAENDEFSEMGDLAQGESTATAPGTL
ncbi:hypothetical protein M3D15_08670 [Pseudoclavibacter alba]|uniref:Uncharacterized protein n=1 Tax=Pseudoclavibacter albus TaxID=272241 RepID=A0ABT2HZ05_9MICO|nr:hypothetical protein [Pseudoclavibacter alba]MCT2043396.1 hypothetical protein [Pseudoclavibacter alba]